MNAAEITDKLGLHSLRQRAWVSLQRHESAHDESNADQARSTSNRPAPHPEMGSMRVSNGSAILYARLATSRYLLGTGALCGYTYEYKISLERFSVCSSERSITRR